MARSSTAALQLLTPQLARSLCCPVLCMYWAQSAKSRLLSSTFRQPEGLQLGVRLTTTTVTELEDATSRSGPGTRNYQEPGAGRTKRELAWGWSGDGGTGDFYSVYDVLNGALVTIEPPPVLDAAKKLVAQYDRDANGSYIVSGLTTTSLNKDATNSNYVFTVAEGVANVWGTKIDKPTATGLSYPIDPDLQTINNEPKVSAGPTSQT